MDNQITALHLGQKFKRTPAGEIPVDWEAVTFRDSFLFLRTANNSRSDLNESDKVGYIHYGDIHTKWRTKLQCDRAKLPRINQSKIEGIPSLRNGDLVMADASEDYEGLGVSVEVCNVGEQQIVAGLHTLLLRDKGGNFADGFRGYIQYIPAVRQRLIQIATGGSVYGLSKGNLSDIPIPRPPLDEQKRIAEILASVDETIQKTDAVIAKAKQLKNGLMQQLLQVNSAGGGAFGTIGDCARINVETLTDRTPAETLIQYIDISSIERPGILGFPKQVTFGAAPSRARRVVSAGDIIVSTVRPYLRAFARISSAEPNLVASTGFAVLSPKPNADHEFLFQFVLSDHFVNYLLERMTGSNYPSVTPSDVAACPIPLPPLEQQRKIGAILAQVDGTIMREEDYLRGSEKVRAGLIRVLLSGKLRVRA